MVGCLEAAQAYTYHMPLIPSSYKDWTVTTTKNAYRLCPTSTSGRRGLRGGGQNYFWLKTAAAAAAAKSLQSCPTLYDPINGSPPGSPVPGILKAKTLEWVAISFSNAWKWKVKVKSLSRVWLFATPWTAAYQAPPSMGFSRVPEWVAIAFSRKPLI